MAPVTIQSGSLSAYKSSGNVLWSAHSIFAYRTVFINGLSLLSFSWGTSQTIFAQSFVTTGATTVGEIRILLNKTLAPTDNVSCEIRNDVSNKPGTTVLGTADTVWPGTNLSTTQRWTEFHFNTPVAVSASTKYWIVVSRSGAADASNFYGIRGNSAGGPSGIGTSSWSGSTWGTESTTNDWAFHVLSADPIALYAIVQDTSALKIRALKSTDNGATWTEQDSANAPTVFNANYPYDAAQGRGTTEIAVARFTGTNTIRSSPFNPLTDTWGADHGGTDATALAANIRNIRIMVDGDQNGSNVPGRQSITFPLASDDSDLQWVARNNGTWGANSWNAVTSVDPCMIVEGVCDRFQNGYMHRFQIDPQAFTFYDRSTITTTFGTAQNIDATGADTAAEHPVATYTMYEGNPLRVLIAYIDADGTLQERVAPLEVTSGSVTFDTQHQISSSTSYAGQQLSTCKFGNDLYVFASTGSGIDYFKDTGATGSWGSVVNWKSGITNCFLSQAIPITGVGILVSYTDNGDAKVDLLTSIATATRTIPQDAHVSVIDQTRTVPQTADISVTFAGQTIFLNADVSGTWTTQSGGTTGLFGVIDETVADDADYIRSTQSPATASTTRLAFGPMNTPSVRTGHVIQYRYAKDDGAGPDLILTAKLYESTTLIATDTPITVTSATFTTRTWNLTTPEATSISNYDNLEIQLEAVLA